MEQQTFAEVSFERYRKATRRERFLDEMARVIPWSDLAGVVGESIRDTAAALGRNVGAGCLEVGRRPAQGQSASRRGAWASNSPSHFCW